MKNMKNLANKLSLPTHSLKLSLCGSTRSWLGSTVVATGSAMHTARKPFSFTPKMFKDFFTQR